MIPTAFDYERATSLDDALAKLRAAKGDGEAHRGRPQPRAADEAPARASRRCSSTSPASRAFQAFARQDGTIEIGAGTVHHDVASSALLRRQCPMVAEAAAEIGDQQVRNRGTLGGSLAHADPSADYPAVMLALDAEIHIEGPKGWRAVKARDFFQGLFTVDLAADEIITGVQFAPVRAAAYAKLRQRASHFAIVGVAAALDVKQGTIRSARIGLTGAASHATRLTKVEEALAGKTARQEHHRRGRGARRGGSRGRQRRHPRQRSLPPRDGPRVHAPRAGRRDGADQRVTRMPMMADSGSPMLTSAFAPIAGGWFTMGTELGHEDERPPHRCLRRSVRAGRVSGHARGVRVLCGRHRARAAPRLVASAVCTSRIFPSWA